MTHDPRTPHPRTVLWMAQREQCATCTHLFALHAPAMRCGATFGLPFCIDAREPGQPCGPEAKLRPAVVATPAAPDENSSSH